VTIGFALQDIAKNFFAGILLLLTQPFEIGDTIDVQGFTGKVLAINLRSTELREVDGRYVIIPNADVFVSPIVNFTRAPKRRIKLPFGLTIDSDLGLASRTALASIKEIRGVLEDPAPQLTFESFTDSVIQAYLFFWIDTAEADYLDAQAAGALALNQSLREAGIVMPYPTVEVTMVNSKK
jgi:small-conductance mechanosensitive channel